MNISDKYEKLLVYGGGALFIILNAFFILREFYLFPVLVLIPVVLYFAFFSLNRLFMAVVFLTPLSIELSLFFEEIPVDLSLPTEPLIIGILLLMLFRLMYDKPLNRDIIYHPVSLAVIFYIVWLMVTTMTSTMPLVSLKFLLVRIWFTGVFFFLAIQLFRQKRNISTFIWCYVAALTIVIVFTLYKHAGQGLVSQAVAHWVVRPFYNDHTAYGAALAMFIPMLALFSFREKGTFHERGIAGALLVVFLVALVFSYSRAAWISLVAVFGVWLIVKSRIRFSSLVSLGMVMALLVMLLWSDIIREMERNTQDSSADFGEHIRSITNITSDASNLERLNRWNAAMGMFRERPVTGFGPGTYMFQYAPYQHSEDRTIISTNLAEGGDAHSEYLGPLAETGFPGMISFILVAALAMVTGFRLLNKLRSEDDRRLVLGALLGLISYLVHGFLNNFLHSDKAAVPFWGFIAVIVAMDLYGKRSGELKTKDGDVVKD